MIDTIIFDLDGVLIDAKMMHFNALNSALRLVDPRYVITLDEHLSTYDGLKTMDKLKLLTKLKGLPESQYDIIWRTKQAQTQTELTSVTEDIRLVNLLQDLKRRGYTIACCSNSIRGSVYKMLARLGIIEYFDMVLSNSDVENPKPHPEIYWKCISKLRKLPSQVLILEDSPPGLLAASQTNATVARVSTVSDVTLEFILQHTTRTTSTIHIPSWKSNMNIVIPMAGAGSRFQKAGYSFPKPLISVNGKPMIQHVVENINIDAHYIFIVQRAHNEQYNLQTLLALLGKKVSIVEVDGITDGAARTVLTASHLIDNELPLLMVNSDQLLEWNSNEFMYKMQESTSDGCIITFDSTHPMYSFVRVNEQGMVMEVAEKKPISSIATTGHYYWSRGSDFVRYANQMINKNIRTNNEFYVCPVYNEAILDGKRISTYHVDKMWSLGTPEELTHYLSHHRE